MSSTLSFRASWGVTGLNMSRVDGIVTDFTTAEEPSFQQETDENGSVCVNTYYDNKISISITVVVGSSSELPNCADQITVNGNRFYVTSASLVESNSAYKKMSISAERYAKVEAVTKSKVSLTGKGLSSLGFSGKL